jgi:hypothetical protein
MITAVECDRCKAVEQRLNKAAKVAGINLDIKKYDSSTDEAIGLGIDHELNDVPSFVVDNRFKETFNGVHFLDSELEECFKKFAAGKT